MKPIIVIPARIDSSRLPRKALADIAGVPMVVRVMHQAMAARIGPVVVACCGQEIADVVTAAGGRAIITDPLLPSGTDRIVAALKEADPNLNHDVVINLQGDLPTIDPADIAKVLIPFAHEDVEISTLATLIKDGREINNVNVVKVATTAWQWSDGVDVARAIYFSRQSIPANAAHYYHHIGIYGYRRSALEKFVSLPVAYLEQTEKLEQLRALEAGMRIEVVLIDHTPASVDVFEDLMGVRALFDR